MATGNEIVAEAQGNLTVLKVKGDVTSSSETAFNECYFGLDPANANTLLIKFEENAYINSGGIAVLIQILAESQRKSQKVGLVGLSDHFQKIFKMVGITRFAEIYPSVEEAAKNLST
jgi:anti-anti-sigma factor